MIKQNQPILPSAGILRPRWIKPAITSILAVGMLLTLGTRLHAQVSYPIVGNESAAQIIDNQLQSLGYTPASLGISGSTVAQRFTAVTKSADLITALTNALYEFPAPNTSGGLNVADNPGYPGVSGTTSPYTPEDLTTYILEESATDAGSTGYVSLAPSVVKAAITALQAFTASYPNVPTDKAIDHIAAGATTVLVNRMTHDGFTAAQISSAVAGIVTNTIKQFTTADLNAGAASGLVQEIANELQTPPSLTLLAGTSGVVLPTLTGFTPLVTSTAASFLQTETVAVGAEVAAIKEVNALAPGLAVSTATSAIASLGRFFESTVTSGTSLTVNQSFVVASIKGAPSGISGLALNEEQAGEALAVSASGASLTAPSGLYTTATGAASYISSIATAVSSSYLSAVVQGAASLWALLVLPRLSLPIRSSMMCRSQRSPLHSMGMLSAEFLQTTLPLERACCLR